MDDLVKVKGYSKYYVSRNGEVVNAVSGKVVKQFATKNGYMQLTLNENGIYQKHLVHRLVAEAYVDKVDGRDQVNHIDGDKQNNHADNLEWVTRSYNQYHRYNVLHHRGHNPSVAEANAATSKKVICIDTGEVFPSITKAAKSRGRAQSALSEHLMGKRECFDGMKWRFV